MSQINSGNLIIIYTRKIELVENFTHQRKPTQPCCHPLDQMKYLHLAID
jgi:hypothetical protein